MRVLAVISGILPYPKASSGNPVVTWAVVKSLLDRGHEVSICTFKRWRYDICREEAREFLEKLGVRVYDLDETMTPQSKEKPKTRLGRYAFAFRRAFFPRVCDHFPQVAFASLLAEVIATEQPDALYVYDFPAAATVARLTFAPPRLTALVNLNHLHNSIRRLSIPISRGLRASLFTMLEKVEDRRLASIEIKVIRASERVVEHAAHHANWLIKQGVTQCIYLPIPVVDKVGTNWQKMRRLYQDGKFSPVILFIGRLDSLINRPALKLLAFEILPVLEKELGPEGFQLNIVGAGDLLPEVKRGLERPSVQIHGFVENAGIEFLRCDVLLVPTTDTVGFRTRIAEGFSYGCCVVSHSSNTLGMPELVHEENALLGNNGFDLARQVVRAIKDSDLRQRLQGQARKVYETKLSEAQVCRQIVHEIEKIAVLRPAISNNLLQN